MKGKYDLPEHLPNDELWRDLERSKALDNQLARELKNLPLSTPKGNLWLGIEAEMDQESSKGYYWWSAAAILLLMSFGYLLWGLLSNETPVNERNYLLTNTYSNLDIVMSPPKKEEIKEEIAVNEKPFINQHQGDWQKVKVEEELALEEVDVPVLLLPELEPLVPQIVSISEQMIAKNQSFHEVAISWGLNDKIKIRTAFSDKNEALQNQEKLQQVRNPSGKLVLKLSKTP
ncbi:hypothetical protein IFO69_13950 [Echinicola sp. CAU 1574]|uniref:Uncharacterized protein n=1 Tax=Echinicola arenosa TaxID=2774144 RepID=A0ABR9AND0_9BACT|nr:hypothetical protein [Echinicola arenosa]MBD8489857.1 hypothetical protein [Echinicola arenosa]